MLKLVEILLDAFVLALNGRQGLLTQLSDRGGLSNARHKNLSKHYSTSRKESACSPRCLHRHMDGGSSNNSIRDTKENDTLTIACYYQSHLWKPKQCQN